MIVEDIKKISSYREKAMNFTGYFINPPNTLINVS